ncbi:Gfo/Idh/MocA family protein [Microbacterium saperdae]|uniref:Putative dehydrogenase n=1 Tax=Microbacterium saperdae TaxID=69368 RepID=A0A543BL97_9MICO|nr:Gfo/Idh/MocA family oxidoreductase [Microbacterium saperdae]TQL85563.1 putative dehydrogenase [Microbacterium saperdae]GGM62810.1 dehydrogenase [Microbacterium saperdae]
MTATEALRVGIIGTGMIATAHVRAARDTGAIVVGVLGSRPERSAEAAEAWALPAAWASLDDLIEARPDVVHICTPNNTHLDLAKAVTNAGLNIVVEKPVATTVEDARDLAAAVERAGTVATVPYVYRYHPLVREIRARRIAGDLGRVLLVHGSYLQDWLLSAEASTWRIDPEAGGASRAFADIGSHWADLAEFVSGERFTALTASASIAHPTRPIASGPSFSTGVGGKRVATLTEDIAVVTFRTEHGVLANTVLSQVSGGRKNRLWLEVDGSEQSAVFDQEQPDAVWFGSENGASIVRRGEGDVSPDQARLNLTPAGHPQGWPDAFAAFLRDTYAAVRGEKPEGLPTIADGVRSVEIIESFLHASRSGSWTEIAPAAEDAEVAA